MVHPVVPVPGEDENVVQHLIETCEAGVRGFREAADLVDNESVRSTFQTLAVERQKLAVELHELIRSGQEYTDSGMVKAAAHRAWMRLKDLMPGDSTEAVVGAAEEGEDYALEQYDEALDQGLSESVREVVARQREQVKQSHDRVRSLEVALD